MWEGAQWFDNFQTTNIYWKLFLKDPNLLVSVKEYRNRKFKRRRSTVYKRRDRIVNKEAMHLPCHKKRNIEGHGEAGTDDLLYSPIINTSDDRAI